MSNATEIRSEEPEWIRRGMSFEDWVRWLRDNPPPQPTPPPPPNACQPVDIEFNADKQYPEPSTPEMEAQLRAALSKQAEPICTKACNQLKCTGSPWDSFLCTFDSVSNLTFENRTPGISFGRGGRVAGQQNDLGDPNAKEFIQYKAKAKCICKCTNAPSI